MRDRSRFKRELGLTGWPPFSAAISPMCLGAGAALPLLGANLPAWPASPEAAAGTLLSGAALAGLGLGGLLARRNRPAPRRVEPDNPDGLVVGVSESGCEVVWPTDEQVWHGILVGKPGSGKTVQLMSLAYQKIRRGGSVVFIDAKPSERNLRQFLWMAKTTGRLDDLRALLPGMPSHTHSINPLSEGDEEAQTSLLTSLRRFKGSSATEHYQDIHDDVVAAVIGVLKERRDLTGEHYHWGDVLAALSSDAARAELMSGRLSDAKSHLASMLQRYMTPDKKLNVRQYFYDVGGVITLLRKYVRSGAADILLKERGEIDLYDLLVGGGILYVAVPTGSASKSAWSWALLVTKVLTAAVARMIQEGKAPAEPVLACLDELKAYLTEEVALAFAQWREGGVGVVAGLQSITQMRGGLDELDAQILDNCAMKEFYAQAGWDGAEAAAQQLGKSLQLSRTYASGSTKGRSVRALEGMGIASRGRSESFGARELWHFQVEPVDLMALPVGCCYHRHPAGHLKMRAPLFQVPDEELPSIDELRRFPVSPVRGIGLWERFKQDAVRTWKYVKDDSDGD